MAGICSHGRHDGEQLTKALSCQKHENCVARMGMIM
jgi:hypothetical protein